MSSTYLDCQLALSPFFPPWKGLLVRAAKDMAFENFAEYTYVFSHEGKSVIRADKVCVRSAMIYSLSTHYLIRLSRHQEFSSNWRRIWIAEILL